MTERTKLIAEYLSENYTVSDLSRKYGVSRKTIYKWVRRFESGGPAGLEDRSRAPHRQANAIAPEVERQILDLKMKWPLWGAPKILAKLKNQLSRSNCPAESTVSNVLKRHGLTRKPRKRRRAVPSEQPLSRCNGANEVWCADFKGWFRTADGNKCTPLTVTDAHSRYLLRCQGLGEKTGSALVKAQFEILFRQYGMPLAILTDNGPPFACAGLGGLTALSVWWARLGLGLERIEPGKPQQNGRHEQMHRTLKEATAKPPESTLSRQQQAFDQFRAQYNHERPHEALEMATPGEVYTPSNRDYPAFLIRLCKISFSGGSRIF